MNRNKADLHMEICRDINALYQRKNHDYGDSFAEFYAEFGLISTCMRLTDKLKRLKSFAKGQQMQVKDESVMDTLVDLANYAIMTLVEMKLATEQSQQSDCSDQKAHCPTCKHEEMPIGAFPCSDCFYGNGVNETQTFYEPKEEQP